MAVKAYSYLRFSSPEQMKGDSYRRQTSRAQEYAARNKLELDERLTFQDLGVSAFRGKNSETGRLADFREAVRAGLVERGSVLLVESLDRISRQSARKALRVLEEICEEGITVITLSDGRSYTVDSLDSDPTTLLMSLLIFIRANEESTSKAGRIRDAWTGKRQQAGSKPLTSRGPGWLKLERDTGKWSVIEERAAVVQRVFRETLEGRGQNAITESLNREGVPVFGKAGHWHRSYVMKLLNNPAVMGTFTPCTSDWQDGKQRRTALEPVPGYFPAVVDPETFQRVQAMRQDKSSPARGIHAKGELQNILGGLLECSRCGSRATTVNKGPRSKRYVVCSRAKVGAGCTYTAMPYAHIEQSTLIQGEHFLRDIPSGGTDGSEIQAEWENAVNKLGHYDDALAELGEAYRNTRSPTILNEIQKAERERDELSKRASELAEKRDAVLGPFVERRAQEALEALKGEPMDRKRVNALLRALFSGVTLNPDTGYMSFRWKGGGVTEVMFTWPV